MCPSSNLLLFKLLLLFLAPLVKMECLSEANTQFSLNLFKNISEGNPSKNVFYSPISISFALAMLSLGAKGNTAAQIFKVLGFTNPPTHCEAPATDVSMDQIHSSFNKLIRELNKPGAPYVLSLANRLYGEQSDQFVEKFLNDTKKYYEAKLEEVDFKMNSEAARVDINKWVEEKTQDKIKDLLSKSDIDALTKLVLVNAIYFKGNWEKQFPKEDTRDGQFKLNKFEPAEFPLAFIPEMNSQVLELPVTAVSMDQIHSSFNKLMSELKKPGAPYVLSLANRLYGEQSYQFLEKFLNDIKKYYEAKLEEVDFKMKSEAARVDINKWVEEKTQEKIKNLLPQRSIDASTRLVLVNAIYFKGNWEKKFPKEATRDGQFEMNKAQTKPVKMMNQKAEFPLAFIPEMNSQVLELPYVGKNLSMLIILPNEIQDETTGLQKLEKALTYEKLMEWTKPSKMRRQEVKVSLPRFKMEESYDMKSLLIRMGMEDVFNGQKVNLSGMSPNNDLVVTKVIHKSFVEVNEEGTEASAATGVIIKQSMQLDPKTFTADHPFLFFIQHNPSNSILFYGRFCSP